MNRGLTIILDCMDKFKWSTKGYYKNGYVDQGPMDTVDHCACACAKADQHKCVAFGYRNPLATVAPKHCYFYEDVADLKEVVQDDDANTYIKMEQGKTSLWPCLCIAITRYKKNCNINVTSYCDFRVQR